MQNEKNGNGEKSYSYTKGFIFRNSPKEKSSKPSSHKPSPLKTTPKSVFQNHIESFQRNSSSSSSSSHRSTPSPSLSHIQDPVNVSESEKNTSKKESDKSSKEPMSETSGRGRGRGRGVGNGQRGSSSSFRGRSRQSSKSKSLSSTLDRIESTTIKFPDQNQDSPPYFEMSASNEWIYPSNYPKRDYQYEIVQTALFQNTLVSLPTGTGKTFIAAVVMFNFCRWFPQNKVVFLAPTKPLVGQQIEACFKVMGMPQSDMCEMTGHIKPERRTELWAAKRLFFLTPQVLCNDLKDGRLSPRSIVCLVIDEAHRSQGNYSFCTAVRAVANETRFFRVLALSATPGPDIQAIQQVISNLLISKIEMRTEDDLSKYSHGKEVEVIEIPPSPILKTVRDSFKPLLDIPLQYLCNINAHHNRNADQCSKFMLLESRDRFRSHPPAQVPPNQYSVVEAYFAISITMAHQWSLLNRYGIKSFATNIEQFVSTELKSSSSSSASIKTKIFRSNQMGSLLHLLHQLKLLSDESLLSHYPQSCAPPPLLFLEDDIISHPKMKKLREIVHSFFFPRPPQQNTLLSYFPVISPAQPSAQETYDPKIMIFTQYRESVEEITQLLTSISPNIRPASFVGQAHKTNSKGLNQKEQSEVLKKFIANEYNVLVCTSVAEEGIDIGDVDLIVCFDSHPSPTRLVQRMGRTGRKREGRCIMLLSEGEGAAYRKGISQQKKIYKAMTSDQKDSFQFFQSELLIPADVQPQPVEQMMEVREFEREPTKKRKRKSDIVNPDIIDISNQADPSIDSLNPKETTNGEAANELKKPGKRKRSEGPKSSKKKQSLEKSEMESEILIPEGKKPKVAEKAEALCTFFRKEPKDSKIEEDSVVNTLQICEKIPLIDEIPSLAQNREMLIQDDLIAEKLLSPLIFPQNEIQMTENDSLPSTSTHVLVDCEKKDVDVIMTDDQDSAPQTNQEETKSPKSENISNEVRNVKKLVQKKSTLEKKKSSLGEKKRKGKTSNAESSKMDSVAEKATVNPLVKKRKLSTSISMKGTEKSTTPSDSKPVKDINQLSNKKGKKQTAKGGLLLYSEQTKKRQENEKGENSLPLLSHVKTASLTFREDYLDDDHSLLSRYFPPLSIQHMISFTEQTPCDLTIGENSEKLWAIWKREEDGSLRYIPPKPSKVPLRRFSASSTEEKKTPTLPSLEISHDSFVSLENSVSIVSNPSPPSVLISPSMQTSNSAISSHSLPLNLTSILETKSSEEQISIPPQQENANTSSILPQNIDEKDVLFNPSSNILSPIFPSLPSEISSSLSLLPQNCTHQLESSSLVSNDSSLVLVQHVEKVSDLSSHGVDLESKVAHQSIDLKDIPPSSYENSFMKTLDLSPVLASDDKIALLKKESLKTQDISDNTESSSSSSIVLCSSSSVPQTPPLLRVNSIPLRTPPLFIPSPSPVQSTAKINTSELDFLASLLDNEKSSVFEDDGSVFVENDPEGQLFQSPLLGYDGDEGNKDMMGNGDEDSDVKFISMKPPTQTLLSHDGSTAEISFATPIKYRRLKKKNEEQNSLEFDESMEKEDEDGKKMEVDSTVIEKSAVTEIPEEKATKKKSLLDLQKEEEKELQRKRLLYKKRHPSPSHSRNAKLLKKKKQLRQIAAQKMLLMDLEAEEEEDEEGESVGSDELDSDDLMDEDDDLSGFIANNDSFDYESASEDDTGTGKTAPKENIYLRSLFSQDSKALGFTTPKVSSTRYRLAFKEKPKYFVQSPPLSPIHSTEDENSESLMTDTSDVILSVPSPPSPSPSNPQVPSKYFGSAKGPQSFLKNTAFSTSSSMKSPFVTQSLVEQNIPSRENITSSNIPIVQGTASMRPSTISSSLPTTSGTNAQLSSAQSSKTNKITSFFPTISSSSLPSSKPTFSSSTLLSGQKAISFTIPSSRPLVRLPPNSTSLTTSSIPLPASSASPVTLSSSSSSFSSSITSSITSSPISSTTTSTSLPVMSETRGQTTSLPVRKPQIQSKVSSAVILSNTIGYHSSSSITTISSTSSNSFLTMPLPTVTQLATQTSSISSHLPTQPPATHRIPQMRGTHNGSVSHSNLVPIQFPSAPVQNIVKSQPNAPFIKSVSPSTSSITAASMTNRPTTIPTVSLQSKQITQSNQVPFPTATSLPPLPPPSLASEKGSGAMISSNSALPKNPQLNHPIKKQNTVSLPKVVNSFTASHSVTQSSFSKPVAQSSSTVASFPNLTQEISSSTVSSFLSTTQQSSSTVSQRSTSVVKGNYRFVKSIVKKDTGSIPPQTQLPSPPISCADVSSSTVIPLGGNVQNRQPTVGSIGNVKLSPFNANSSSNFQHKPKSLPREPGFRQPLTSAQPSIITTPPSSSNPPSHETKPSKLAVTESKVSTLVGLGSNTHNGTSVHLVSSSNLSTQNQSLPLSKTTPNTQVFPSTFLAPSKGLNIQSANHSLVPPNSGSQISTLNQQGVRNTTNMNGKVGYTPMKTVSSVNSNELNGGKSKPPFNTTLITTGSGSVNVSRVNQFSSNLSTGNTPSSIVPNSNMTPMSRGVLKPINQGTNSLPVSKPFGIVNLQSSGNENRYVPSKPPTPISNVVPSKNLGNRPITTPLLLGSKK